MMGNVHCNSNGMTKDQTKSGISHQKSNFCDESTRTTLHRRANSQFPQVIEPDSKTLLQMFKTENNMQKKEHGKNFKKVTLFNPKVESFSPGTEERDLGVHRQEDQQRREPI